MKTKQLKQLLVLFSFCLSALMSNAQGKGEQLQKDLDWLNENTTTTHRYGILTYDQIFFFTKEGLEWTFNGRGKIIRWYQIEGLSVTTTGRVYIGARLAPGDTDYFGTGFLGPEYVTPKDGVTASQVMYRMLSVLENLGYKNIKGTMVIIGDADEDAEKKKEQQSHHQLTPEDEALSGFIDFLGQARWEFSGAASFDQLKDYQIDWSSRYKPIETYALSEVRVLWAFGGKHFKFNISPFAFTWMTLPSYKKYNEQGTQIDYSDFGSIRYYSPALGFTYSLIPKKQLKNDHPMVEFPITVNFAPLLGNGKTDNEIVKNETYDTQFEDYFEGLKFNVHGSVGVHLYTGEHFGFGLTVGGTYVNVKASKDLLTESISSTERRRFTYQFDNLSPFIPTVQLKLILR